MIARIRSIISRHPVTAVSITFVFGVLAGIVIVGRYTMQIQDGLAWTLDRWTGTVRYHDGSDDRRERLDQSYESILALATKTTTVEGEKAVYVWPTSYHGGTPDVVPVSLLRHYLRGNIYAEPAIQKTDRRYLPK